jgi:hypothetical protein
VLFRYRWAFIGTAGEESKQGGSKDTAKQKDQPRFMPHIIRLARLLNARVSSLFFILLVI